VGDRTGAPPLGEVVGRTRALLRTGAAPADAWAAALGRPVGPVPAVTDLVGTRSRRSGPPAVPGTAARALAVVAAARLSVELGAPLAALLDHVAEGVVHDEEAAADRAVALAGPRSTARLLAWLPVGGLAVAGVLGADPVAVALDGGLGTAAVVVGVLLVLAGRAWTSRLVAAAGGAGP
jgi:tight adherence protein B